MAKLVGWREWVSLPELGVDRVKVKVDTGARTSALHASELVSTKEGDLEFVSFTLHPLQNNTQTKIRCKARVKEHRLVKDSGGREETRVVIETNIILGDDQWTIELTLADRETMAFRMLLGRNAIRNQFYVDPTRAYLLTAPESDDRDFEEE